jgi:hypothetical protein
MFRIAQMGIMSLEIWGSDTVSLIELGGCKYCTHGLAIDWLYRYDVIEGCGRVRVNQSTQHVDNEIGQNVKFRMNKAST